MMPNAQTSNRRCPLRLTHPRRSAIVQRSLCNQLVAQVPQLVFQDINPFLIARCASKRGSNGHVALDKLKPNAPLVHLYATI